jgi:hypothetical protein
MGCGHVNHKIMRQYVTGGVVPGSGEGRYFSSVRRGGRESASGIRMLFSVVTYYKQTSPGVLDLFNAHHVSTLGLDER